MKEYISRIRLYKYKEVAGADYRVSKDGFFTLYYQDGHYWQDNDEQEDLIDILIFRCGVSVLEWISSPTPRILLEQLNAYVNTTIVPDYVYRPGLIEYCYRLIRESIYNRTGQTLEEVYEEMSLNRDKFIQNEIHRPCGLSEVNETFLRVYGNQSWEDLLAYIGNEYVPIKKKKQCVIL
jgi:hypothetical protein